jgi:hypothetical protein
MYLHTLSANIESVWIEWHVGLGSVEECLQLGSLAFWVVS